VYTAHFGLREMPFSITPDPAYLYMSPRHQEALGHLLYGTGEYGGFVQLTGEVGTGKTTIVRTLLAQKLDHVDVAVILNPRQSEREFVHSICDELGVNYPKKSPSLKTLVDALNTHLLEAHANGRRTVVIIDEAQNLQPEVLEQVRLLTNLETDKAKLLRIMLVGQPELADLLARPDLRQLAQRITARYHLTPLSAEETDAYITHRLGVAGGSGEVFVPGARQLIHRHARGVPRLVNVLSDRALLGAYAAGAKQVTPDLVERAAREVAGPPRIDGPKVRRWTLADAAIIGVVLAVIGWYFWTQQLLPEQAAPVPAPAPQAAPAALAPAPAPAPAVAAGAATVTLDQLLHSAQPLPVVLSRLVQVWNANPQVQAGENICQALTREKLQCFKALGEWRDLRQLNRPAILTLSSGRGGVQHVLLRKLGAAEAELDTSSGPQTVRLDQVDLLWTGEFLLLWRQETEDAMIGPQAHAASIAWLRQRLSEVEGHALATSTPNKFDDTLRESLTRFQAAQGLDNDGLAGPRTLIVLGNLKPVPGTPSLIGEKP